MKKAKISKKRMLQFGFFFMIFYLLQNLYGVYTKNINSSSENLNNTSNINYQVNNQVSNYSGPNDFLEAKHKLIDLYKNHQLNNKTFYCDYTFNPETKKVVDLQNSTIEIDHIVPISYIGNQLFDEYKNKDKYPECANLSKRKCARKRNKYFNIIEADLYNLVPAVDIINRSKSDYLIGEVYYNKNILPNCYFKISKTSKRFTPKQDIRGDIARVYMYIQKEYGVKYDNKTMEIIKKFNNQDPVSKEECESYFKKKTIMKKPNPVLEPLCETYR